jgi:hypothetical protein
VFDEVFDLFVASNGDDSEQTEGTNLKTMGNSAEIWEESLSSPVSGQERRRTGGEWGIRTPDRAFDPITV